MTPFGERVRKLRHERGLLLKDMAAHLGVSSAYLSALERGERGKPTWTLIQGVIHYFNIIWDEADELARLADLSDPRVRIDTSSTNPRATLVANRLAREIRSLTDADLDRLLAVLDDAQARARRAAEALVMDAVGEALATGPAGPAAAPLDRA
jgi:transcriptional regulator with XRE-family HTH domain